MSQLWPILEDFDYGVPPYGLEMIGYLGAVPVQGENTVGALHDGYGNAAGARHPVTPEVEDGGMGFVLRRDSEAVEVDVRVALRKAKVVGGSVPQSHMRRHGVIARCAGGAVQGDGTPYQRLEDIVAYSFEARRSPITGDVNLVLVRYNAGVETVLASSSDLVEFGADWVTTHIMRLTVEDAPGGDVTLRAYLSGVSTVTTVDPILTLGMASGGPTNARINDVSQGGPPAGKLPGVPIIQPNLPSGPGSNVVIAGVGTTTKNIADKLVLEVVDASAPAALQASVGRCGFIIDDEFTASGASSVSICESFEVRAVDDAVLEWRDEWLRRVPTTAAVISDTFSTTGRCLQSHWSRDAASTETGARLERTTTSEQAQLGGNASSGECPDLDGTTDQYLSLVEPSACYPIPSPPETLKLTVAIWANITEERDGNELYQVLDSSSLEKDVLAFGLRTGSVAGQVKLQVRIGDPDSATSGAPHVVESGDLPSTLLLNQTWCYVLTWDAGTSASSEGVLRVYVGRSGFFNVVAEDLAVPAEFKPSWRLEADKHWVGRRDAFITPGSNSLRYLKGRVDQLAVFYTAISGGTVNQVCNQLTSAEDLTALGAVHICTFEDNVEDVGASKIRFPLTRPVGVTITDSWEMDDGVTVGTGLTLIASESIRLIWSQRAADDPTAQDYEVKATLGASFSMAGVALHAAPVLNSVWDGYWCAVGEGSPCAVTIYRRIGNVNEQIATADQGTNLVNVALATEFTLRFTVEPSSSSLPTGPVELAVYVNDTRIPFDPVPGKSGISNNVLGDIIDASGDRIVSGDGVGMIVIADSVPTGLDAWDVAVGGVIPPVNADDFASMQLDTREQTPVGVLNDVLEPQWRISRDTGVIRDEAETVDARTLLWATRTYEPRYYALRVSNEETAAVEAMRTFVDEHFGPEVPFVFDPSGFGSATWEQPGVFRFTETVFEDIRQGRNHGYAVTIEEVPGVNVP